MKYEVGNKVRIKSIDWYSKHKDSVNRTVRCGTDVFTPGMVKYCGQIATITKKFKNEYYYLNIDDGLWSWTDDMFEEIIEEEVGLVDNLSSRWINEFNLPEGYIFKDENGNVINATRIVLEKRKKEYPKTYRECCKVLEINSDNFLSIRNLYQDGGEEETTNYEKNLLDKFTCLWELIICRNAYWKLYSEEMGSDKPWEPDWKNEDEKKWVISRYSDELDFGFNTKPFRIFAFPTEEVLNTFKENFDKDLEFCKELL